MNKKFLNKNTSCFFNQILPENILSISKSKKKRNRKNSIFNTYNSPIAENRDRTRNHGSNQSKNKSEKMKRAEAQIVREFCSDLAQQKQSLNCYTKEKVTSYVKAQLQSVPLEKHSNSISYISDSKPFYKSSAFTSITDANFFPIMSIEQIRNVLVSNRIEKRGGSELKSQLLESRKIRILYGGLSSRQLQRNLQRARTLPGGTCNNLLYLLESRLDVVLERCAFFTSIQSARQFILHKKVKINSKVINMPGYQLKPGDIIQVLNSKDFFRKKEKSKKNTNVSIDSTALNVVSNTDVTNDLTKLSDTFAFANACIGKAYASNVHSKCKHLFTNASDACDAFTQAQANASNACLHSGALHAELANSQFSQKERTNKHIKGYYSLLCGLLRLEKSFFSLPWKKENINKISFSNLSTKKKGLHTFANANISTAAACIAELCMACNQMHRIYLGNRNGQCINSTNPSEVLALLKQAASTPPVTPVQVMHLHQQTQWALDASKKRRNLFTKSIKQVFFKDLVENSALLFEIEKKAIFFKPFFADEKSRKNYKCKKTFYINEQKQADKLIQAKNAVQLYYWKRLCYETKDWIKNSEKLEKKSFIDLYLNRGDGTQFRTFQDTRLDVRDEHSETVASKQKNVIDVTLFDQTCDKITGYKYRFLKPFYNQCFYWLELRKKMLLQKNQKENRKNYKAEIKNTHGIALAEANASLAERRSASVAMHPERKKKALHLEISYQSLSAIFLYPPQRVHLPALIDIELLVKNL